MAVEAMRKSGKIMTQNQMLAKCISDYNEKVVVKRWKIDSKKRKIIQNLLEVLAWIPWHPGDALRPAQTCQLRCATYPFRVLCFGKVFFQTCIAIITLCCYKFVVAVLLSQGKSDIIDDTEIQSYLLMASQW